MMKKSLTILILTCSFAMTGFSQGVVLGSNPVVSPEPSTLLEVEGTDGGLMIPQLTQAQRQALSATAAEGLWVYQTDQHPGLYLYHGGGWVRASSNRTVSGQVQVDGISELQTGIAGSGFSAVQNATDLGEFDVSFTTPFSAVPTIMLTSQTLDPIPVITSPAVYCYPVHTADCNTQPNADYLDDFRVQSCPFGTCNYGPDGFQHNGTNCDSPGNDNYTDYFGTYTATLYGPMHDPSSFFNIYMRSSYEWRDNLFVFIDWNQDGDFQDADETVFEFYFPSGTPTTQAGPNGADFTLDEIIGNGSGYDASDNPNPLNVPATAANGVTVIRAMSKWATTVPNPCGTHTWGETQDYRAIVIGGDPGATTDYRASNCTVSSATASGFKVYCTDLNNNRKGATFHFMATDN
jgi:hypothetical protein